MMKTQLALLIGMTGSLHANALLVQKEKQKNRPNVIIVVVDQWRSQAFGFMGDPNVKTPKIDQLSQVSMNFSNAVSVCPVCTPARASLFTGRYPTTTGMFMNDLYLPADENCMAEIFKSEGYNTGYIGKWHLDGHGRQVYIPEERRQGFDFWNVLECTHDYNHSRYYAGNDTTPRYWNGYDAFAQTGVAQQYIIDHSKRPNPFLLVVSFGPPHAPHQTAPERFKKRYNPDSLHLRANVPPNLEKITRQELAGYYSHCTALDSCVGEICAAVEKAKIAENTILVFTSDHGEMMGSQGIKPFAKQRPWDESIRVPFLIKFPGLTNQQKTIDTPINTPDILPTLLGMCNISIPSKIEGEDFSELILKGKEMENYAALIMNVAPFGDFFKSCEFRGIRTSRYTYVRNLVLGPWLFYDNLADPYQLNNLVGKTDYAYIEQELSMQLDEKLTIIGDKDFKSRDYYLKRWGYSINEIGGIPYSESAQPVQTPVYTKLKFFP